MCKLEPHIFFDTLTILSVLCTWNHYLCPHTWLHGKAFSCCDFKKRDSFGLRPVPWRFHCRLLATRDVQIWGQALRCFYPERDPKHLHRHAPHDPHFFNILSDLYLLDPGAHPPTADSIELHILSKHQRGCDHVHPVFALDRKQSDLLPARLGEAKSGNDLTFQ